MSADVGPVLLLMVLSFALGAVSTYAYVKHRCFLVRWGYAEHTTTTAADGRRAPLVLAEASAADGGVARGEGGQ